MLRLARGEAVECEPSVFEFGETEALIGDLSGSESGVDTVLTISCIDEASVAPAT